MYVRSVPTLYPAVKSCLLGIVTICHSPLLRGFAAGFDLYENPFTDCEAPESTLCAPFRAASSCDSGNKPGSNFEIDTFRDAQSQGIGQKLRPAAEQLASWNMSYGM
jgi:hypothetical protein